MNVNKYLCACCGERPAFKPSELCAECEAEMQEFYGDIGIYTEKVEPAVGSDPTTCCLRNSRSAN